MSIVNVGCAVIIKDGKLLMAQRHSHDTYGDFWEFPGGKQECDESLEQCLVREVKEELAIDIKPIHLLEKHEFVYPERTLVLCFYLCEWIGGEPQCLDCQAVKWVTSKEISGMSVPPGDEGVLSRLVREKLII